MAAIIGKRTSVEELSQGLDRATFKVYAQADRHLGIPSHGKEEATTIPTSNGQDADHAINADIWRLNNLRRISTKVKSRTEKIFHPKHRKSKSADSVPAPMLAPPPSKANDDDRMFNPVPEQKGPDFMDVVKNPISSVQSALHGASGAKFAEALDNQVIAHGAEVKIIRAYDDVKAATSEDTKVSAQDNLEDLKKERQDAFVRWTIDRHVLKVRQVQPCTTIRPKQSDYKTKNENGKLTMQWLDYGHNVRGRQFLL